MSVHGDIYTTLGQHAGLSSLVGARIYIDEAVPNANAPYVVWQEVSATPVNGLDGHQGLDEVRIQVVSLALKAVDARNVAQQVRYAMRTATLFAAREVDFASSDFEIGSKTYGFRSDFSLWWRS